MEFAVCDSNRPVCFCLAARGEARKLFGVEEGDPAGLGGCTPVEQSKEDASGIVDTRVLEQSVTVV